MNADELTAETKTDRIVRLALAAGKHSSERDELRAEVARLRGLCEKAGISTSTTTREPATYRVEPHDDPNRALVVVTAPDGHEIRYTVPRRPMNLTGEGSAVDVSEQLAALETAGIDTEEGRHAD